MRDDRGLGVAQIGYAFMGAAHSQAWRTVAHAFALPLELRVLVGRHGFMPSSTPTGSP